MKKQTKSIGTPHALAAEQILSIFESVPGLYLILNADAPKFTIVAVSDAYAKATMTQRKEIVGKGLFEIFPDNPEDPQATGVKNLTASLMSVLKYKKPHKMPTQKYDIRKPKSNEFEERYWDPLNVPVLDKKGTVSHIVHSVVDATRAIVAEKNQKIAQAQATKQEKRADRQKAVNQELTHVNELLQITRDITELKHSQEHLTYLSEASKILSSSLNSQEIFQAITILAVPQIADWCAVDILNEKGVFDIVSIAHTEPKKVKLVKQYRKAHPIDMHANFGLPEIVRSKKSEFVPEITDDLLIAISKTKKDLELTRN